MVYKPGTSDAEAGGQTKVHPVLTDTQIGAVDPKVQAGVKPHVLDSVRD